MRCQTIIVSEINDVPILRVKKQKIYVKNNISEINLAKFELIFFY